MPALLSVIPFLLSVIPVLLSVIPVLLSVIPAEAGIQKYERLLFAINIANSVSISKLTCI